MVLEQSWLHCNHIPVWLYFFIIFMFDWFKSFFPSFCTNKIYNFSEDQFVKIYPNMELADNIGGDLYLICELLKYSSFAQLVIKSSLTFYSMKTSQLFSFVRAPHNPICANLCLLYIIPKDIIVLSNIFDFTSLDWKWP